MGRPSKRTPTVEERIVEAIKQGMTYKLAAQYGGISYETLRNWLKQGEDGNEEYAAFFQAVQRAEAEGVLANLQFINKAMDWRARAWVLEHRHADEYGSRNSLKITGDDDAPIAVRTVNLIAPAQSNNEESHDDE